MNQLNGTKNINAQIVIKVGYQLERDHFTKI